MEYPSLTIRGLTIGAPAACRVIVPVAVPTAAQALASVQAVNQTAELAELRLDVLNTTNIDEICDITAKMRAALKDDIPLLATIRTKREGGELDISPERYTALCLALCALPAAQRPDMLDVELTAGCNATDAIAAAAKSAGVKTVFSCHHFDTTPPVDEMCDTLCLMAARGADIAKLAVMPASRQDAASLLAATAAAAQRLPHTTLITMAMGELGSITRVCGGYFGSCATFGTAGAASAPGQPEAARLRRAMDAVADCLL